MCASRRCVCGLALCVAWCVAGRCACGWALCADSSLDASGKSAVRLKADGTGRLPVPFDVHKFLCPAGDGVWRAPRTLTCSDGLDLADGPVVLHYANCGYEHWRRK
jgi:hypothetical protein